MTILSRIVSFYHVKLMLLIVGVLCSVFLQSCDLFLGPGSSALFIPSLEWVNPTKGVVMDINSLGNIVSVGNTTVNSQLCSITETYDSEGKRLRQTSPSESGIIRDIIANYDGGDFVTLEDYSIRNSSNYTTLYDHAITNPYTKYNTRTGNPATNPYPWSYGTEDLGPSVAKGPKEYAVEVFAHFTARYTYYSAWIVGSFTDSFKPDIGDGSMNTIFQNTCPTYGKADCFIVRRDKNQYPLPVRHQWGGPENDLAYDVASDDIGNATIFLRAGSDFGITSATQSLVRMKIGYNIVRLDTNGLLTETFPVSLEAMGELTDTQIALGNSGAVYILAKDEQRKQYFLAKVSRSGMAWTRYLPASVSDRENSVPSNRTARMGLTVDSKDCAYITGNFSGTVDFGGASLSSSGVQAFVAKYSPNNSCLGALAMGSGLGVTVRLSPDEKSLYVNGWAVGKIMGTDIPDQNDERNGVLRPGAFLVKLKMTK